MIRVNEPIFGKEELRLVSECIKTNWISSEGPFVKEFEHEFARFCGVKYGVACSSGTAALHLGLLSLGLEKGDEVIIPTFTMIATAYAVMYIGAKPVLVDAEPRTWNMDVAQVVGKITRKTKVLLPVHIYGHPVDIDPLRRVSRKFRVKILEDAAEAHGAEYKGVKTGALGDAAAFSFYANKIVTTGEGGMLVTDNSRVAEKVRYYRNMAFQQKVRYLHKDIGYNYRMTNLQAAVGVAQVLRINSLIEKKRWIARCYNERLKGLDGLTLPREEPWVKNVYWMYSLLIDKKATGFTRDAFRAQLLKEGVDTRAFFFPMHKQPVFLKQGMFRREKYPVAEDIARRGLYLPSGMALTESQIDFVCTVIKKIIKNHV
ncbi:MAG TPA: aminotransferase DegT [Candidatus Omnitrophica bacterium]|nr:aminotransferase DegT [Candidatus Omnitrophota bacterium]